TCRGIKSATRLAGPAAAPRSGLCQKRPRMTGRKAQTLSLALLLLVLAGVFASMAQGVARKGALTGFDEALALPLPPPVQARRSGVRACWLLTIFGSRPVLYAFAIAVALLLVLRGHRVLAFALLGVALGSGQLEQHLKQTFQRPRPEFQQALVAWDGWSF